MSANFNSKEELIENIEKLEERITKLENENKQIKKYVAEKQLPQTTLISKSFLTRAFTVWGHFFTAHLIISIFFLAIYLCVTFFAVGSLLSKIRVTEGTSTPAYQLPAPP